MENAEGGPRTADQGQWTNHVKEADMTIEEGKAAPDFTLPDADGKAVSLKDFRGKNIILYFYPKDNTSG